MNPGKDYYSLLGVMPDAEDIVIKAAYRALAQRYHPDRFGGSQEKAHAFMSELNEAYGILSNQEKRRAYDQLRTATMESGSSRLGDMEEKAPPGEDPLQKDWRIALSYYADLARYEERLAQFSWKLSNTYRAYLLESKQFESREALATLMENHFLGTYFGDNERTLEFARRLIVGGQRGAALALNNSIRVLGINAAPARIIGKIAREFNIRHLAVNKERISSLLPQIRAATTRTALFIKMLSELGGSIVSATSDTRPGKAISDRACKVEFEGRDLQFSSEYEFRSWFMREVIPMAEQLAQ